MKKIFSLILLLTFTFSVLSPAVSFAQVEPNKDDDLSSYELLVPLDGGNSQEVKFDGDIDQNLGNYVNSWYERAIGLVAVFAVLVIIIYGFQYSFSETVFKKISAKERIMPAVGALVLLLVAYILLTTINDDLVEIGGIKKITVESNGDDLSLTRTQSATEIFDEQARKDCVAVGVPRFSCDDSEPDRSARDGTLRSSGGVYNENLDKGGICYSSSKIYCDHERRRNQNSGLTEEQIAARDKRIEDLKSKACKEPNGCVTVTSSDSMLKEGGKACLDAAADGCQINRKIRDNFSDIDGIDPIITEGYPPTVNHRHECHFVGTCVDARFPRESGVFNSPIDAEDTADMFFQMKDNTDDPLYPVLEFGTSEERESFFTDLADREFFGDAGERVLTDQEVEFIRGKSIIVEGISAPHFSVYTSKDDANKSGGLNSKGDGYE